VLASVGQEAGCILLTIKESSTQLTIRMGCLAHAPHFFWSGCIFASTKICRTYLNLLSIHSLSMKRINEPLQDSIVDPMTTLFPKLRSITINYCGLSATLFGTLSEPVQLGSLSLSGLKYPDREITHPLQHAQFQSLQSELAVLKIDSNPGLNPSFDCSILCGMHLKSLSIYKRHLSNLGLVLQTMPLLQLTVRRCRLPWELYASKTFQTP
jgi:hypothetical protein